MEHFVYLPRQVAIKNGHPYYYHGTECTNGHVRARYTKNGQCAECVHDTKQRQLEKRRNGRPKKEVVNTTDKFIKKSFEVYGDVFDCSYVVWAGSTTPVDIYCNKHKLWFSKTPNRFLGGENCPECGLGRLRTKKMSREDYIDKFKRVHGDFYDYSEFEYTGSKYKVVIICPEHGRFEQSPEKHAYGRGCTWCSNRVRLTPENFVERSYEVHGDKYDYSKSNVTVASEKVEIVCTQHGSFWQSPSVHLKGHGCRICAQGDTDWGKRGYYGTDKPSSLYFIRVTTDEEDFIKVGLSANPQRRLRTIENDTDGVVEVLDLFKGKANELYEIEHQILYNMDFERYKPKVYFNGYTECFSTDKEVQISSVLQNLKRELNE